MKVYDAKNYVEFVVDTLSLGNKAIPRGRIKDLANLLRCHASFISQIIRGKAHMSHEQAHRFCSYAQLSDEETEFFINLLNRDRAGTNELKALFNGILKRKLVERRSLQKRARLTPTLSRDQEIVYFQSFTYPLIHAALHLPDLKEPKQLSITLGIPEPEVSEALKLLNELGLATQRDEKWHPTVKNLHVGKESPLNRTYHANWRLKTAMLLQEGRRTHEHTHFTSLFCISKKDVERIRELILTHLEKVRQEMVASDSERLFVLCLDYFPI